MYYCKMTAFSVFYFRCKDILDDGIDAEQKPTDSGAVGRLKMSGDCGDDDER